jgi:hypothetical protein
LLDLKTSLSIKDPIYGYSELTALEKKVIESPIFQRLRFITQNGLAFYTYPSIRGSRFEHCIGACHLAGRVFSAIVDNSRKNILEQFYSRLLNELGELIGAKQFAKLKLKCGITEKKSGALTWKDPAPMNEFVGQLVRLLALLHDIGHLPFSHLGEEAVEPYAAQLLTQADYARYQKLHTKSGGKLHEFMGYNLVTRNCGGIKDAFAKDDDILYFRAISGIYASKLTGRSTPHGALLKIYELVSSDIDVDRGDYLKRDGYSSGIGFGDYDTDRLVDSIQLESIKRESGEMDLLIAPSDASISPAETFLVERYNLYKWLYYHHSIRYFNYCLVKSLDAVIRLSKQLPKLRQKFKLEYFQYDSYVFEDGFISNEIWLWDVFYLAYIGLKEKKKRSPEIEQALVYLDVIRWRRKLGFTVWKTHPEYLEFNKQLKDRICRPQNSDSMGQQHFRMENIDLAELPQRSFFNTILQQTSKDKGFLEKFYKVGLPITYGDVKGSYPTLGLRNEEKLGTIFIVPNQFEPFARSSLSTSKDVISKFEFLLKDAQGSKKVIRLTEVSRLAASLYDAWQSDIQSYLYFVVSSAKFENIVTKEKRQPLAELACSRFCEEFARWLIEDKKLVTIAA